MPGLSAAGRRNSSGPMRRWPTSFRSNAPVPAWALARSAFMALFNWPLVLTDAQIEARILRATGYVLKSQHCSEMRALLAARQRAKG